MLAKYILFRQHYKALYYFNVKSNRELYNVGEIRYISSEYNLLMADLYRPVNWGRINARPVIIDFGFTRRVRKKYY